MDIYYTYLIGWKNRNVYYYGSKYGRGSNPETFWKNYFTSSAQVREKRQLWGEPDIIQIRKTFSCKKRCQIWEMRVLRKIKNSKLRKMFLNKKVPTEGWINNCLNQHRIDHKTKCAKSVITYRLKRMAAQGIHTEQELLDCINNCICNFKTIQETAKISGAGLLYLRKNCPIFATSFYKEMTKPIKLIKTKLEKINGEKKKTRNYVKGYKLKGVSVLKGASFWYNGVVEVRSKTCPGEGFTLGRQPFNNVGAKIGSEIGKLKRWITNGEEEIFAFKTEPLLDGWRLGRSNQLKKRCKGRAGNSKGKIWINDGISSKMSFPSNVPQGWKAGRL